jgi:hypothetical protein
MQTLTSPTVASSPYTITHNLGTTTPVVQMWDAVTNQMVSAQISVQDANHLQVRVAQNMPNNVNVIIIGSAQAPAPINPADYANKSYVDARTPNLPAPVTSGTTIQTFTDALGDVWVAKNGVNAGAWKRARDVLHARVWRNAAFNWTTAAAVLVFDTIDRDVYGVYSTATGQFSAIVAGWYHLQTRGLVLSTAGGTNWYQLDVYKNGSLSAQGFSTVMPAGLYPTPIGSGSVYCAAGDYLTVVESAGTAIAGGTNANSTFATVDYLGTG